MNYFRAANRAFLVLWVGWILYWVGFAHWRWANDLANDWIFPPKDLPADFFDEPRHRIHEWIADQKLDNKGLAQAVRQYYRSQGCRLPENVPPPPKGFVLDCPDPYGDLSDNELAERIRVKYEKEYRPYFNAHWHRFEKYRGWHFGDYYLAALKLSWVKSRPPGVEFVAGLAAPAILYAVFVGLCRWVWRGSKRPD
jgi:hypothetical protein